MTAEQESYHIPVLMDEVLEYLHPQPGETFLDLTLGGAGHSSAIAKRLIPNGVLIGTDRDREAIEVAKKRLAPFQNSLHIIIHHSAFNEIDFILNAEQLPERCLDGVLLDAGVSSHQLDAPRGFSLKRDEFLDMRMDTSQGMTAQEFLATADEQEIARVLWEHGEERFSRKIAQAVVALRKRGEALNTTGQLARLVEQVIPRAAQPKEIHAATRTFQGIRIHLNSEIDQLQAALDVVIRRLKPGGRCACISFHSLEDRVVKQTFAKAAGRTPSPPGSSPAIFRVEVQEEPTLRLLTKKPIMATPEEVGRNPRARSAKLRVAQCIS
ncbi:MAG: 16S rRNA (cytosine(1402)-N(4))-methyltransferase RsmH [Armatimonadetes bacterium]|nr:16S rRNA (cytosine(1402)-N(4))-methyltransferase RsmH [Armatimonadota bacterium]